MAELTIRFDVRLSQRLFRWLFVALMVFASVADVGSESVTLNTYYPAPSGVYQYMVTTNNTFLARDNGAVNIGYTSANGNRGLFINSAVAKLGIGTQSPSYALDVADQAILRGAAGQTGLFVNSAGNVGIGTTGPGTQLTVSGSQGTVNLGGNGWVDPGAAGASVIADNNGYKAMMIVGNNIGGNSGKGREVKVWDFLNVQGQFNVTGTAGVGNVVTPLAQLDVGGNGVIIARQTGCSETSYTLGTSVCPGGQYATLIEGIMTEKQALGNLNGIDTGSGSQVYVYNGSMFCCPQANAAWPW